MRKKKQRTRRQLALRWMTALAVLLAYILLPGQYHFRPEPVIREAERLGKLGPTNFIAELSGEEGRTLRGNDRGMMAITLYHTDVTDGGWKSKDRVYLNCSGSEPFYAGFCSYTGDLRFPLDHQWADWFGCVDCPEAAAVRLEIYKRVAFQDTYTLQDTCTVPREDWVEQGGRIYFAISFQWKIVYDGIARSELLDEAGNVLCSRELRLFDTLIEEAEPNDLFQ